MKHSIRSRCPASSFGLSFALALGTPHIPAKAAESLYLPAAEPPAVEADPVRTASPTDTSSASHQPAALPSTDSAAVPTGEAAVGAAAAADDGNLEMANPEFDGVPLSPEPEEESPALAALPKPIAGNGGKFMCPFTADGTVALWVEKGRNAGIAGNLGGTVGTLAGQKLLEQVPFIGGFFGQKIGAFSGRELAVQAAGGWAFINKNSDQSFDDLTSMAIYIHGRYASHPEFAGVLKATTGIYPDFGAAMAAAAR